MQETPLLKVDDLKAYFFSRRGVAKAVDGVSFSLHSGETLGLVGESGCGKTITSLSIMRLLPQPTGKIVGGSITFDGEDLLQKTEKQMREIRGRKIAMILQDPMTSLNPVFTIGSQVADPIRTHQSVGRNVRDAVVRILREVRIPSPEIRLREYPHQLSGGMRQRVVGAIALSCQPKLLIADEPTTALDVTIQAQFLKLLKDVQAELNFSLIMITHNLGIVATMCDRVAVVYAGRVVETAPTRELFRAAGHPYTRALLNSLPKLSERVARLSTIEGQPPDLIDRPDGCAFAPRCASAQDRCLGEYPPQVRIGADHTVSCWLCEQAGPHA
jgi:oligopeptide/dipeptide ABC transporter ATP-binding protein